MLVAELPAYHQKSDNLLRHILVVQLILNEVAHAYHVKLVLTLLYSVRGRGFGRGRGTVRGGRGAVRGFSRLVAHPSRSLIALHTGTRT